MIGRKIASIPDFEYSKALNDYEGAWTFEELNRFLARSTEIAPGTKMEASGITDATDRANLIAYLRTLSDSPVPIP